MNLIDRDAIVKVAEHAYAEWNLAMAAADGECEINRVFKMKELCRAVKAVAMAAPIVDAAPVVHARWLDGKTWAPTHKCSHCGFNEPLPAGEGVSFISNFCPNCGADMRKENDNGTDLQGC